MIYKGFITGYIITIIISILGTKTGLKLLFPSVILNNIIFLPVIFLLATSGIRMYKRIIKREINIKQELVRHTIIMLVSLVFAIIVSCISAYFSTFILHFL